MARSEWMGRNKNWRNPQWVPAVEGAPIPRYDVRDVVEFDFTEEYKNGRKHRYMSPPGGGEIRGVQYDDEMGGLYYFIAGHTGHSCLVREEQIDRLVAAGHPYGK